MCTTSAICRRSCAPAMWRALAPWRWCCRCCRPFIPPGGRPEPSRWRHCVMNDIVIRARGLERSFAQASARLKVLEGVDLEIQAGEQVGIRGRSGVGKCSVLHLLGGLDKPTAGGVEVAGVDMARAYETRRSALRSRHLGFVYQFHHLLPEFTALENVAMPLLIARQPVTQARARAVELLERVGLGHRLDHKPGQLSGGRSEERRGGRECRSRRA